MIKYQVQRRTNFGGCEELAIYSKHNKPLEALCQMKKLASIDVQDAIGNYKEITISRTSDSCNPDAFGMTIHGILIKANGWWWQWEVIPRNFLVLDVVG